jgi:hypothetical protein
MSVPPFGRALAVLCMSCGPALASCPCGVVARRRAVHHPLAPRAVHEPRATPCTPPQSITVAKPEKQPCGKDRLAERVAFAVGTVSDFYGRLPATDDQAHVREREARLMAQLKTPEAMEGLAVK